MWPNCLGRMQRRQAAHAGCGQRLSARPEDGRQSGIDIDRRVKPLKLESDKRGHSNRGRTPAGFIATTSGSDPVPCATLVAECSLYWNAEALCPWKASADLLTVISRL